MPLDDALADAQSNPRTWQLGMQSTEDDKDVFELLGVDPDTVVLDREDPAVLGLLRGDVDFRCFLPSKLYRIGDEVSPQLHQLGVISHDSWELVAVDRGVILVDHILDPENRLV